MGKLRPEKSSKSSQHKKSNGVLGTPSSPAKRKPQPIDAPALLAQATALLQQGQPDTALSNARRALFLLSPSDSPTPSALSALSLLGEIHIELGDAASALETFKTIVSIDPEGSLPESNGQGADPFLELAQLCDGGGKESIQWFDRGIAVLEREIQTLSTLKSREEELEDKRRKLAAAICGKIEVWMTDLSLEAEAESQCESLIAKALLTSPKPHPHTLQTLASIRLSQSRLEDAQSALTRSLETWSHLPADHADIPDFSLRISLARLLMEAEMEETALEVVEKLVGEDDHSVEAWYLGGWCLWLMGSKTDAEVSDDAETSKDSERNVLLMSSREWLRNCLTLYGLLEYEDDKLRDHATELVSTLDQELGDAEIEDEEDGWEDDEDERDDDSNESEDHEMNGT